MPARPLRRAALTASLAAATVALALTPAAASLPTGTTAVPVSAGNTATGIDAILDPAGSIAGRIVAHGTGDPVTDARIQLFDADRHPVDEGDYDGYPYQVHTRADGTYRVPALNRGRYYVCVYSDVYVDTCYGNVRWPTGHGIAAPPKGAKTVSLGAGQQRTAIDVTLQAGGRIRGTVRATSGKADHPHSVVWAVNRSNGDRYQTESNDTTGRYALLGLSPSARGYAVCFDASSAVPRSSKVGYLDRCFRTTPWAAGAPVPKDVHAVKIRPGRSTTGVDVALPPGGAIAGTVRVGTKPTTSTLLVRAFSHGGAVIAETTTSPAGTGRYKLRGLPRASADRVCVQTSQGIAIGRCHGPIAVRLGHTTDHVDFALKRSVPSPAPRGTVTGTITHASGGAPVEGATVSVYDATGRRVSTGFPTSDAQGHFQATVRPGTGYRVCSGPPRIAVDAGTGPGVAPGCFGAAWNGGGAPPAAATTLTVKAGTTRSGVNIALPDAGAISGTITDGHGHGLGSAVQVYDDQGRLVRTGYPYDLTTGAYKVIGLAADATGYTVCFRGAAPDLTVADDVGYLPECFQARLWDVPVPQAEYGSD